MGKETLRATPGPERGPRLSDPDQLANRLWSRVNVGTIIKRVSPGGKQCEYHCYCQTAAGGRLSGLSAGDK